MPTSVRLDPETDALLRRCASATGRTKSSILREAVARFVQYDGSAPTETVYHALQDLIGIEQGEDPTLSKRADEIFRNKVRSRARA